MENLIGKTIKDIKLTSDYSSMDNTLIITFTDGTSTKIAGASNSGEDFIIVEYPINNRIV